MVSSKEATKKRASGQAEVCRWVMILFIGFFTALVAFGIDEGAVQNRDYRVQNDDSRPVPASRTPGDRYPGSLDLGSK